MFALLLITFSLQIHGLKRHKLDMGQILPSIGFRHSDGMYTVIATLVTAQCTLYMIASSTGCIILAVLILWGGGGWGTQ